ncbi:hypothetical protein WMY93_010227 [Mugilogobius chulae]|uniref:Unc-13-like protein D n=1 Tax=Mugilogobius chulae TaxID=88201 RepID=A0AAW0PD21_9GOBI
MATSQHQEGNMLLAPQQSHSLGRQKKSSPAQVRKLGLTRKRDRRDVKEDENPEEKARRHKEFELKPLYKELLYTIAHRLGKASCPQEFTEAQLRRYIQEAFNMTDAEHSSLLEKAQNTEPPVYCLMATIKEAKGILGKDVSGFSDPYCLLTIMEDEEQSRRSQAKSKHCKSLVKDAKQDNIYQTDIKKQTLNPIWNQTFILEFVDMDGANFHLEMWDKDEEVSLTQKLEEIKTLNSLRRMIKDAKKEKGTDDFLGRISLKLQDLHCTEDHWYHLEPRTETYPDRGQCHLNLKFIHKSRDGTLSAGRSAYINYCGILQQFVQAYMSKQQSSAPWKGELCGEAQVLLEQYATQNDLSPFLQDLAKWVAYSKLYQSLEVDSSVLLQQLTSIEYHWHQQELPYQQAFQKLNPAQFDLHEEVIDSIQLGTEDWFSVKKGLHQPMTKDLSETASALSRLISEVQEDIKHNKDVYNRVFVSAVQVDAFTVVIRDSTPWGVLELTNFHENFREALPYWLNQAFSTTQDRVERACRWTSYCKILKERVRVLTENSEYGSAINMLCVVVNDLEHLRSVLTRLPSQLNWPGLKERTQLVIGERQFHNTLPSQLQQAQDILSKEIRSALDTLGKRLNTDIETHVRSMATRKRFPSKSTEDVAAPLMRYLEKELQYMNENLVQENFNSLLTPLWNNSVKILYQVATQPQQEGLMVYCQRLLYTLQCLEQCFHAEGNGLPLSTLHSDEYKTLKAHLTHNSLSSFQLMEKFFETKITEQKVFSGEKYGAVTLLTSYHRSEQNLRVEVLNAVNLLPMDSNGLSDPFVQLCLEPSHIFPEVEPRCTQIKNCDLNPLFEEVFNFMVSLEQCTSPGACLMVTVLDHDTLRTDDFEGEAFLGLKSIPGVGGAKQGEEGGAGFQPETQPAQIRLPLMHPKPNDDSILKLLETRKGEREAQVFVKKRRLREKQSQENIQP